jgi:flagellar biosynthesis anti-sigma factor FlgM
MAVRINGQNPLGNVDRAKGRATSKKSGEKEGAEGSAAASEKVSLSERGAAAANEVRKAAAQVQEVDEAKVAQIRAALARGEYHADLRVVAERIIAEAMAFGGDD